jgi:hypothetical protein
MIQQAREINGTIVKDEQHVKIDTLGLSALGLQISGTFVATLQFEGTVNGIDWESLPVVVPEDSSVVTSATAVGIWLANVAGLKAVRIRASAYTSGTINVSMIAALSGGGSGTSGSGFNTPNGDSMVDEANNALKVVLATALSNLIDKITAYDATDALMNGTTALTPKFAKITASSSGATEVVAAVTSKKIRPIGVVLVVNATVNVKFQSHTTPTDLTGLLYLAANGGFAPGYNPKGYFETLSGQALDINLSGNVAVGGWLVYVEV